MNSPLKLETLCGIYILRKNVDVEWCNHRAVRELRRSIPLRNHLKQHLQEYRKNPQMYTVRLQDNTPCVISALVSIYENIAELRMDMDILGFAMIMNMPEVMSLITSANVLPLPKLKKINSCAMYSGSKEILEKWISYVGYVLKVYEPSLDYDELDIHLHAMRHHNPCLEVCFFLAQMAQVAYCRESPVFLLDYLSERCGGKDVLQPIMEDLVSHIIDNSNCHSVTMIRCRPYWTRYGLWDNSAKLLSLVLFMEHFEHFKWILDQTKSHSVCLVLLASEWCVGKRFLDLFVDTGDLRMAVEIFIADVLTEYSFDVNYNERKKSSVNAMTKVMNWIVSRSHRPALHMVRAMYSSLGGEREIDHLTLLALSEETITQKVSSPCCRIGGLRRL